MTRMRTPLVLVVALLVATACAGRLGGERDGPPADGAALDADGLPDVVPRNEPLSPYGNPDAYEVFGRRYHVMDTADDYAEEGIASWYGTKFHGRRTSSGEPYNMYSMTAAHTTLPLPTYVRVTNLDNGRSVVVRVNDRGPFVDNRIIDLSYAAARRIDMHDTGTAPVRIESLPGGTPIRDEASSAATGRDDDAFAGDSYIQLGAFSEFANAQRMRARAAGADIRNVTVQRGRNGSGSRIYRVRIGPFGDASQRNTVIEKLERAGIEPGQVVFD